MTAAALISLREGLEAALIVGILLSYLKRIGQLERRSYVWIGVLIAVAASLALAGVIQLVGVRLEGRAEQIFEGATMFLAVGILTWMIFWMRYQARLMRSTLERGVQKAVERGRNWGLVSLAFVAVFREGVETVLFLSAAAFATGGRGTLAGAGLGLALAILLGYLVYASTARLNIRLFFTLTSAVLLLFAAGLLAHGIHELQGAGLLSSFKSPLWDVNHILNEESPVGQFLKALFGYNGNPSLEEVAGYFIYWVLTLSGLRWWMERKFSGRQALTRV